MSAIEDYPANFETDSLLTIAGQFDQMLDEIDRLRRWKSEAECVIEEWDHLWEMAGCPGELGKTKAAGLLSALQSDGVI